MLSEVLPEVPEEAYRVPKEIILSIGGWDSIGPCNSLEVFNSIEGAWKTLDLKLPFKSAYHGIGVIDSKVIIKPTLE